MPEVIPFPQAMRALLLELLQQPPVENTGMGEQCTYCHRFIWGNYSFGLDSDFAPQDHAPSCLIARIGLLFPKLLHSLPDTGAQ